MLTTQASVATRSENSLEHLTNFGVAKERTERTTNAFRNEGNYVEEHNLVAGMVCGLEFAVRYNVGQVRERRTDSWRIWSEQAGSNEVMEGCECGGCDRSRRKRRPNELKEWIENMCDVVFADGCGSRVRSWRA